jgi:hypothetical protein
MVGVIGTSFVRGSAYPCPLRLWIRRPESASDARAGDFVSGVTTHRRPVNEVAVTIVTLCSAEGPNEAEARRH